MIKSQNPSAKQAVLQLQDMSGHDAVMCLYCNGVKFVVANASDMC